MRRAILLSMLPVVLAATAACDKEETLPEPMLVGEEGDKAKGDASAGDDGGDQAPDPGSGAASSCSPKAGEVCFQGAEVEHAAVLLHTVTGADIVVAGSYDKRIDGVISTASATAAVAELAKKAELEHKEIGGVHYLASSEVMARGGGNAVNFCREPKSMVVQRTDPQELAKRAVEDGGKRLQGLLEGEVTLAVSDVNTCVIVQHLVHFGGGTGRVDAKALRVRGDVALPKSTRAAGTPCAPLDTDKVLRQPCHKNVDLAVVGVGQVEGANVAIVRRTGRVFEPVAVVKKGEHVGDYHDEVGAIDATGLKAKTGKTLVAWAP